MEEIVERIRKVLMRDHGIVGTKVAPDATLYHDLALDSLQFVEVVYAFEDEFNIDLDADELASLSPTVGMIAEVIARKLGVSV